MQCLKHSMERYLRDSSLVQSVERRTVNPYVAGSSPAGGATKLSLNLPLKNFSRQPVFLAFLTICVHFTL